VCARSAHSWLARHKGRLVGPLVIVIPRLPVCHEAPLAVAVYACFLSHGAFLPSYSHCGARGQEDGADSLAPMGGLEEMKKAAKQKGLYVE